MKGEPGSPRDPLSDPRLGEFCRLFNAGHWFEAHEALESLWLETAPPLRSLLQALVQVAVALEHARRGNQAGALRVLSRARDHIEEGQVAAADFPEMGNILQAASDYVLGRALNLPQIVPSLGISKTR